MSKISAILHAFILVKSLFLEPYQNTSVVSQTDTFHFKVSSQKSICNWPFRLIITKTSKTGVYRGIHFFLFLLQNIDCWYSLEAVLMCTHNR